MVLVVRLGCCSLVSLAWFVVYVGGVFQMFALTFVRLLVFRLFVIHYCCLLVVLLVFCCCFVCFWFDCVFGCCS